MLTYKTPEDFNKMMKARKVVSNTHYEIFNSTKPGMTFKDLDNIAKNIVEKSNVLSSFLGYTPPGMEPYPAYICASPNDAIVHGIPNSSVIEEGDIISIDCGAFKNGFYGDHAYTFQVGNINSDIKKLLEITKASLYEGIKSFKEGNRIGDLGYAIQNYCEKEGYGVVRELVGHGLGKEMHEGPEIPNYGKRGRGKKFVNGMVLAIEPMINQGTHKIKQLKDGWSIMTEDGRPSAHFEHNVALIDGKPELLSTFQYIYDAIGISSVEEKAFRKEPLIL